LLAEHVWEHLSLEDGLVAARLAYRWLKPRGYLRMAVPDGFFPDAHYIQAVCPGGTGAGAWDHKVLYTIDTLSQTLREAGFQVKPLEYWSPDGQFNAIAWYVADGIVTRSRSYDERNKDGEVRYTSLIVDAIKIL
jgi:predicted SAM-dependent methyltransferase